MTAVERERAALLRAILENPDDDLPRLAFADHLEEGGGVTERAWAGEIRRDLASMPHQWMPLEGWRPSIPVPAGMCWCRHGDTWVWITDDGHPMHTFWPTFSRGFACKIRCSWAALLACHRQLWESHPVTEVDIINPPVGVRDYGGGDERGVIYRADLKNSLWRELTPGDWHFAEFDSQADAARALGQAVVRWATGLRARRWKRRKAGG